MRLIFLFKPMGKRR